MLRFWRRRAGLEPRVEPERLELQPNESERMFVVEPGSGKNKGYSSARELGAAIRRGELGPRARIYHRATDRWLPITVHPEYRKVAAERERLGALEMQSRHWTFLPGSAPDETGDPARERAPQPAGGPQLIPGDPSPSWLGSTFRRLRSLAHL